LIESFTIGKKYIANGLLRWSGEVNAFCNIIRHVVLVQNEEPQ